MKAHRHLLLSLSVALVAGMAVALYLLTPYTVPGGHEPALYAGDRILVTRTSYGLRLPFETSWGQNRWGGGTPAKGEWMAFNDPMGTDSLPSDRPVRIGRCTAVPGDTVWYTWSRRLVWSGFPSSTLYPIVIPGKFRTVRVTPWNIRLLCNTLNRHERRRATIKGDSLYIDGKATDRVRFSQDYYWVETGRDTNLGDSRYFGFVPASHLIGRARLITYSIDPEKPFYRGFRPQRFMKPLP